MGKTLVPIVPNLKGDWIPFHLAGHHWNCSSRKSLSWICKQVATMSPMNALLGINEEGKYSIVSRYQNEVNKHTLITGNSGSENRHPMSLIHRDIECGVLICAIDMKGSPEFAAKWRRGYMRTDAPSPFQQQQELRHSWSAPVKPTMMRAYRKVTPAPKQTLTLHATIRCCR